MAHIITVTNQKGGVGKTTTAGAVISGLTAAGKKVLGIDLDPQGNLGFSLGAEIEESLTVYELMKAKCDVHQVMQKTEAGDVIPSNILLSGAELEFSRPGREYLLKDAIAGILEEYDYVIIDTPPALNILTVNAYTVADSIIIPMVPEILSILGVSQLKETIGTVRRFFNPKLRVMGILLTKYNGRMILTREVSELAHEIAKELETEVLDVTIRSSIVAAEAPAHSMSVLAYAPRSNAAQDYRLLVERITERGRT